MTPKPSSFHSSATPEAPEDSRIPRDAHSAPPSNNIDPKNDHITIATAYANGPYSCANFALNHGHVRKFKYFRISINNPTPIAAGTARSSGTFPFGNRV